MPALPGCTATGGDREDVERNAHTAVAAHVDLLRTTGRPVPLPSTLDVGRIASRSEPNAQVALDRETLERIEELARSARRASCIRCWSRGPRHSRPPPRSWPSSWAAASASVSRSPCAWPASGSATDPSRYRTRRPTRSARANSPSATARLQPQHPEPLIPVDRHIQAFIDRPGQHQRISGGTS